MNQVLARSINTTLVAIMPILSILVIGAWILGATALKDFGLALFIGLATGAYSSIFIASPLLAVLKEREPYWRQLRERLGDRSGRLRFSPALVAAEGLAALGEPTRGRPSRKPSPPRRPSGGSPRRPPRPPGRRGAVGSRAGRPRDRRRHRARTSSKRPAAGAKSSIGSTTRHRRGRTSRRGGAGARPWRDGEDAAPRATWPRRRRPAPRGRGGPGSRPASGAPSTGSANRPPPRPRKKGRRR